MENCIITNKTIAILKQDKKTIIYDVEKVRVINKNIKTILNMNCNFYGSTLSGRLKSGAKILKIKYKIPIIINENNLILLPIYSLRQEQSLLLVSNKILNYEEMDNKIKVQMVNNQEFVINLSKKCFEKLLLNSYLLNNFLKCQKTLNFV